MVKRYAEDGQLLTSCCGCYSTYMERTDGREALCCKACYREVPLGEGDGSVFKEVEEDTRSDSDILLVYEQVCGTYFTNPNPSLSQQHAYRIMKEAMRMALRGKETPDIEFLTQVVVLAAEVINQ